MSTLTAEQRQRMEENRKRALQKLALLKAAGGGPSSNTSSSNTSSSNTSSSAPGVFKSSSSFVNPLSERNSNPSSSSSIRPSDSKSLQTSHSALTSNSECKDIASLGGSESKSSTKFIGLEAAQRIAENRQKALEKRAASISTPNTISGNSAICLKNNSKVSGNSVTSFYKESSESSFSNSNQSLLSGKTNTYNKTVSNPTNSSFSGYNKGNQNGSKSEVPVSSEEKMINSVLNEFDDTPKPVFGTKTITGTFRLISRERFAVDVGYHKAMLEIFKTMPSRKYDVETKKWDFALSDHDALVEALKPLRPGVCIGPLPHFVRKTLESVAKQMPSSSVDLFGLDPKLLDSLMPFQQDGVCFGINLGGRVMIADDMGLGKTIQALGIAAYYRREWPLLIVTPSSVRYSWVSSIERWVSTVERYDITVLNSGKDHIDDAQVVITSYDLLSRRKQELLNRNFKVVIMDESHMLKSFKTARYKAAAPIMKQCKRLILLSGTPALSRPSELYTQINGLDPNLFPRFQEFGIRYCNGKQLPWGWDFTGSSNMEELQIILQAKLMIRRLKSEVLSQLPPKQRMMVILDPSLIKANTKAMEEAARNLGMRLKGVEKHGALLEFFSQSAFAKLKAVSEYIKELLEGESKFIVFAHHRVMLDKLSETCEGVNAQYIRIDGRTSGDARQQLVNKFQTNSNVKAAILSITAANAGITLTAAQLVVFAEVFWNPGILVQAEDRAHRIGQQDSVTVQYLVAKGTVDDHIWPLVQAKLEVLSKAGLSKDSSLSGEATYQKDREQGTLDSYLVEMINDDEITRDLIEDEEETHPPVKKEKKGGILQYLSRKEDDDKNNEPQVKKAKFN
ncbi:SWI/SNF-related matrix-associated actin-dependent regulator of chromatin subfamily A-like protein 1 [Palaemon carinicauda]|uniref:SWI/SNF-related matrix-associated actin-dependent regulator of chromatin subfamily A-like protein 1 n=1 Tax=Palaemon carinicauda TaxID=392227 RepID=UPI0035B5D2B7